MKEKVFGVIARVMDVPIESVNEESSPDTIGAWDSLKHMNLIMALEEEVGVHITHQKFLSLFQN